MNSFDNVIMENVNLKAIYVCDGYDDCGVKKDVVCDGKRSSAGLYFFQYSKLSVSPGFFPEPVELSILLDAYSTSWSPNLKKNL